MAGQFFSRFGDRVAILHSAFTDVRARRAVAHAFAPARPAWWWGRGPACSRRCENLGLIVVDEEHDESYKQEETPRYHGRDVAVVRAQAAGACVVLGSATPSLESRYNVERGKYTLLELPGRIEARPMPRGRTDRHARRSFWKRASRRPFRASCWRRSAQRLENGEQTMLLLNRRGFSSFVACRACGERVAVPELLGHADLSSRDRRLLCHYCNYAEKVPAQCPKCESEHIYFLGMGSRTRGGGAAPRVSQGAHRPAGSRHRHRQAPLRNHPRRTFARAASTFWWARR